MPVTAAAITLTDTALHVPDHPILLFIEGDGEDEAAQINNTRKAVDAAVTKAYGDARSIAWLTVLAGEKSHKQIGLRLPPATIAAITEYRVGLKGTIKLPDTMDAAPLNTPDFFSSGRDLLHRLGWHEAVDAFNTGD